jgi:hypothetical protein
MSGQDTHDERRLVRAILIAPGSAEREPLAQAVARVRALGPDAIDDLHGALVAVLSSGASSNDLCECAVVLGLADLGVAHDRGLDVVTYALFAARAHQRAGRPERALDLCDSVVGAGLLSPELTRVAGECQAQERRRKHGRDQELLYARRCLSLGREDAARHHLTRALDLDPGCSEAASMLAGLTSDARRSQVRSSRSRLAALALLAVGLPIGAVSMAHVRAAREFRELERPVPQDLLALERRIEELEQFGAQHPLWWGRAELERELEGLSRERLELEQELREANSLAELARSTADQRVEAIYLDARTALEAGRPHAALALLEETLAEGVPSPQQRARLRRDIAAIRDLLAAGDDVARARLAGLEPAPPTEPAIGPVAGPAAAVQEDER